MVSVNVMSSDRKGPLFGSCLLSSAGVRSRVKEVIELFGALMSFGTDDLVAEVGFMRCEMEWKGLGARDVGNFLGLRCFGDNCVRGEPARGEDTEGREKVMFAGREKRGQNGKESNEIRIPTLYMYKEPGGERRL